MSWWSLGSRTLLGVLAPSRRSRSRGSRASQASPRRGVPRGPVLYTMGLKELVVLAYFNYRWSAATGWRKRKSRAVTLLSHNRTTLSSPAAFLLASFPFSILPPVGDTAGVDERGPSPHLPVFSSPGTTGATLSSTKSRLLILPLLPSLPMLPPPSLRPPHCPRHTARAAEGGRFFPGWSRHVHVAVRHYGRLGDFGTVERSRLAAPRAPPPVNAHSARI